MTETINLEYMDWFSSEFNYECEICHKMFKTTQEDYSNMKAKTCYVCKNPNHPNNSIWQKLFWRSFGY